MAAGPPPCRRPHLGHAYRNTGQLDAAFTHCERASPRHRGAHEYVGEAYLILNSFTKAEDDFAAYFIPCEEFEELKEEIEAYKRSGKR